MFGFFVGGFVALDMGTFTRILLITKSLIFLHTKVCNLVESKKNALKVKKNDLNACYIKNFDYLCNAFEAESVVCKCSLRNPKLR